MEISSGKTSTTADSWHTTCLLCLRPRFFRFFIQALTWTRSLLVYAVFVAHVILSMPCGGSLHRVIPKNVTLQSSGVTHSTLVTYVTIILFFTWSWFLIWKNHSIFYCSLSLSIHDILWVLMLHGDILNCKELKKRIMNITPFFNDILGEGKHCKV